MPRLRRLLPVATILVALTLTGAAAPVSVSAGRSQQDELVEETRDWVFRVPTWVAVTPESLHAFATHVQNCTDVVRTWVGHRPRRGAKFVQRWVRTDGPEFSSASADGVTHWVHAGASVPALSPYCRGPHEVTHVLTSETFGGPPILVEGIAEFSDVLFTPDTEFACDDTGYTWYGRRYPYSDLRAWKATINHYLTAACLWYEIRARGRDDAIRRVLASARADRPTTTGDLLARDVSPALAEDLRGVVQRYGFTDDDLTSPTAPRAPAPPSCPSGQTPYGEVAVVTIEGGRLTGTPGGDRLCGGAGDDVLVAGAGNDRAAGLEGTDRLLGGAGNDVLTGGTGEDVLAGGSGNDVLDARDGKRDAVAGGPGRDSAKVDRFDKVTGVERVRR